MKNCNRLLIIFAGLMVASNLMGNYFGILELGGLSFSAGIFLFTPVLFLRDVLQEQECSWKAFLISFAAFLGMFIVNSFFVVDPIKKTLCSSFALMWTFLVDRNVFTYFRRFGWFPAALLSDLISLPLSPIFFYYFYQGGWSVPDGQLVMKYLTVLCLYGIIFLTGLVHTYMKGEAFVKVPRTHWFRFYERYK